VKKNSDAITTMAKTMIVEIMVSRRDGHVTFAVSERTCCRKVKGLVLAMMPSSVARLSPRRVTRFHVSRRETKKGRSKRITLLTPASAFHECAPVRLGQYQRTGSPKADSRQNQGGGKEKLAGAAGFEPATYGFGDRRSTN
jgi:hypothetical protein